MINLIYLDLIKSIRKRWVLIFLICVVIINIYEISFIYEDTDSGEIDGYYEVYDKVKGKLTEEKIKFVVDNYAKYKKIIDANEYSTEYNKKYYSGYEFGDYGIFEDLYQKMNYSFNYNKTHPQFLNRKITSYYNMNGAMKIIQYDFSTLLMVIWTFTVVLSMVMDDTNPSMEMLIKCSVHGRIKELISKFVCTLLLTIFSVGLLGAVDVITLNCKYNIEGLQQPLYAISYFENTIWNGNVGQFIIYQYVLKLLGVLIFSIVGYIIANVMKNSKLSFLIFVGIMGCLIFLALSDKEIINPVLLLRNYELWC